MGKLTTTSAWDSCGLSGDLCPSCDIEWQVTAFSRGMVFHTFDSVNQNHVICETQEWSEYIRDDVVSYMTAHADFGESMLEIGPGPGAATEWLRHKVRRLVALEIDEEAAALLSTRYAGTNVEVVLGDATRLNYPDGHFDSVGSFTMLHHVPTARLQNAVLAEALRVLRPGGVLAASDSLPSNELHHFHADDTFNPVDPGSLIVRLQTIGFERITVSIDHALKFIAHKAEPDAGTGS
jgi:ubiquinone/menaquinone biosynthesis C-methylase UbiE